jgi:hypothetical protein
MGPGQPFLRHNKCIRYASIQLLTNICKATMGTITIDTKKLVLAFLAMLLVGFLLQTGGSRTEHDERAKQPTTEHTSSATPAASA